MKIFKIIEISTSGKTEKVFSERKSNTSIWEYTFIEQGLSGYLNEGYEVKHVIHEPAEYGVESFIFYLEKEC